MNDVIVQGRNVTVYVLVSGIPLAVGCADSVEWNFENEIIGKTDVNAGLFRKKRVRISDFTATISGLVVLEETSDTASPFYFLQTAVSRETITLQIIFEDDSGNTRMIEADYLVQSERLSGGAGADFSEFNLTLEGNGSLSIGDAPSPVDTECLNTFSDWWQPTNGATSFSGAGNNGNSFAGQTIVHVQREMATPLVLTGGTPGDGTYSFDGTTVGVWASNPFNGSEKIFVIWQQIV